MKRSPKITSVSLILCLAFISGQARLVNSSSLPPERSEEISPCGSEFQINIIPRLATQDDAITVTYSAVWAYMPTPMHQSHEVVDHVIRLDAIYYAPEFSLPVLMGWGGKTDVGNLPTGTYRVDVYLTTVVTPTVFPPALCGTRSFTIYEELQRMYLPVVVKQSGDLQAVQSLVTSILQ